jgi:hypothetical protein
MTILSQRKVEALKTSGAQMETELQEERAKNAELAANRPDTTPEELARLREGNNELIRLRGEVNALKRERDDLAKKVGGLESAAARSKEREETAREAAQGAEAAEAERLKGQANVVLSGAQSGMIRRKILAGQPLTPQEQQSLVAIQGRLAELEKNPAAFAQYQSASVASTLGWDQNDPRAQQLNDLLSKVTQAANNRGLTFNAPGQTFENWTDQQKALDNRATTAVKNMLTPEEVQAFDQTFPSILSGDPAAAPRAK